MKFKVGDSVLYTGEKYRSQMGDSVGTVSRDGEHRGLDGGVWISVDWDNGLKDGYPKKDLELVTETEAEKFLKKWKGKRIRLNDWGNGYWIIPTGIVDSGRIKCEANCGILDFSVSILNNPRYELCECDNNGNRLEERETPSEQIEVGDEVELVSIGVQTGSIKTQDIGKTGIVNKKSFMSHKDSNFFVLCSGGLEHLTGGIWEKNIKLVRKRKDIAEHKEFMGIDIGFKPDRVVITETKTTEDTMELAPKSEGMIVEICGIKDKISEGKYSGALKTLKRRKYRKDLDADQDAINDFLASLAKEKADEREKRELAELQDNIDAFYELDGAEKK